METVGDPAYGSSGTRVTAACLGPVRQPGPDHHIVRIGCNVRKKASSSSRLLQTSRDLWNAALRENRQ